MSDLKKYFLECSLYSTKHSTYFEVYEKLFTKFRNKKVTLVEVGVLNGGSLELWQKYLGNDAKIIGIDFNPSAKKFNKDNIDIFIGDQSSKKFWENFYDKVGNIDILIDDGGHENFMQAQTVVSSLDHINEDGVIIIEDTHSSYLKEFGNPSKYSFINYCYFIVENINMRFFKKNNEDKNLIQKNIWSIEFFESIVALNISKKKSNILSVEYSNKGISSRNIDYRHFNQDTYWLSRLREFFSNKLTKYKKNKVLIYFKFVLFPYLFFIQKKFMVKKQMRKFFK